MKIENDTLLFDSGRELDVYAGVVGLSIEGVYGTQPGEARVCGGYDSELDVRDVSEKNGSRFFLTHAECVELADFMVARWAKFGADHAFVLAEAERQLRGTGSPETPVGLLNAAPAGE